VFSFVYETVNAIPGYGVTVFTNINLRTIIKRFLSINAESLSELYDKYVVQFSGIHLDK